MLDRLSFLKFQRVRPPIRRIVAVDSGSRRLKLLLAESDFGRLRLLKQELLDLKAEGLVSTEELKTHLRSTLEEWSNPPLALVLPQDLSISQVIDVPLAPESEIDKLIAEETIKLSGVSESRIVYDFVRTETAAKDRQQFWVTLCQEGEIRDRIARLGVEGEDICEITTTANALLPAFRYAAPACQRAILVHVGAHTTVVVVTLAGQAAFATSFQMGGDFFTRAIARLQQCSEETAESLKRERNLLSGPQALAEFDGVVDGWVSELKRQLSEWFQQNPTLASDTQSFELIATGGGFEQPGLLEYLEARAALPFQSWPKPASAEAAVPGRGFEVAFGAALQALGHSAQPVSLLPEDYRAAWRKRLSRQRVDLASIALLCICVLLLGIGTWHKLSLYSAKKSLLDKVQAGQEAVEANEAFTARLVAEYENLRPVFAAQQNTLDTLKTLSLLQQSRSNRNLWFVLLADQQSYFSRPPTLTSTNRPAKTNLLSTLLEPLGPGPIGLRPATLTNVSLAKPGFIAELCVPGEAEAARAIISDLVKDLKEKPLFSKADLLSDDQRRNVADPKLVVPERDYVLYLDFAQTEFQQPVRIKRTAPPRGPRRTARPAAPAESGDSVSVTP